MQGTCYLAFTYKDSGHIGYSVVPEKRMQGYATEMFKEALIRVKMHKLSEVKVVCSADNIPSRKTIIACGGKLSRIIKCEGADKEEYVITL